MSKITGIYTITNSVNGKVYVGSAYDVSRRWIVHLCLLRSGKHHSVYLQRAWNKYGENAFTFRVEEAVEDRNFLLAREQCWIWRTGSFGDGYNSAPVAGGTHGFKHSEATKEKLRQTSKGNAHSKGRKLSPEHIERIRTANIGRTLSPERKLKLLSYNVGKTISPEHRARLSALRLGTKLSEETKRKIGVAGIGRKQSAESIRKTMLFVKGVPKSEAHRKALSLARLGKKYKPHTEETKSKMREAWRQRKNP